MRNVIRAYVGLATLLGTFQVGMMGFIIWMNKRYGTSAERVNDAMGSTTNIGSGVHSGLVVATP